MMDPEAAFLSSMQDMSGDEEEYIPHDVVTTGQEGLQNSEVDNPVQEKEEASIAARPDASDLPDQAVPSSAIAPPPPAQSQSTVDQPSFPTPADTALQPSQNPPTVEQTLVKSPVTTASQSAAPRPRAIGGFVIDDEDDDGGLAPQTASNGLLTAASSNTASPSAAHSPVSATPIPDVMLPNEAKASTNGEEVVPATDITSLTPLPSVDATVPDEVSAPSASSLTDPLPVTAAITATSTNDAPTKAMPKARLPHDRVGILEDRVKEDPRGDVDAWLSLISEHRKRNKLEDARSVYERFFKMFPSAVSLPLQDFLRSSSN